MNYDLISLIFNFAVACAVIFVSAKGIAEYNNK